MEPAATPSGAAAPSARLRLLLPVLVAAGLVAAILHFGMIQFGGFDGSALLQGAWRYYQGQAPYTEIVAPGVPPSYLVFPGLAFHLFGVTWHSIVLMTALYAAATFLVQYAMLRRLRFGMPAALGTAFAIQAVSLLPISWWHYNQATAVAGALFVTASVLFLRERGLWSDLLFVASTVLLSWMKINVAGLLLAGVGIVMLCQRGRQWRYLACMTVAAAVSMTAMCAARVSPPALIHSLLEASGRVGSLRMLKMCLWTVDADEATTTLAIIAVLVAACGVLLWRCRRKILWLGEERAVLAIAILSLLAGLVGMATNLEHNMVDTPCVFIGAALVLSFTRPAAALPWPTGAARMVVTAALCIGLLAALGVANAFSRNRIASIGPGMFHEAGPTVALSQPELFSGLRVGPRLTLDLLDIQSVLDALPPGIRREGRVFFGPRLEFGYPAYGITPPPGMSVWWMGTGEGRPETVHAVVEAFRRWNPVCGIFLRDDFTYMPPELLRHLAENYVIANGRDMTLLWLKTEPPPPFLSGAAPGG